MYNEAAKNPVKILTEANSYFAKFPPKSVILKGINVDLNSGFIDAHIDFLFEIERADKEETIKDKFRYSLDRKKFQI